MFDPSNDTDNARRRVAAEVIELGEALFDEMIEVVASRQQVGEEDDAFPVEDVRVAAETFFQALRAFLTLQQ